VRQAQVTLFKDSDTYSRKKRRITKAIINRNKTYTRKKRRKAKVRNINADIFRMVEQSHPQEQISAYNPEVNNFLENRTSLKIISTNINGKINDKIDDILRMALDKDIDFVHIQEAKQTKKFLFTKYKMPHNYVVFDSLYSIDKLKRIYRENKAKSLKRKYKAYIKDNNSPLTLEEQITNINPNRKCTHGGMITLMHKRWLGKVEVILDVEDRRFILVILKINKQAIFIINVYAPSGIYKEDKESARFFFEGKLLSQIKANVLKYRGNSIQIIIGGDLNLTFNPNYDRDIQHKAKQNVFNKDYEVINKFMTELKLVDAYRQIAPRQREKAFTFIKYALNTKHKDKGLIIGSKKRYTEEQQQQEQDLPPLETIYHARARLDYFLVKEALKRNILQCKVIQKEHYDSDHKPILLVYKIQTTKTPIIHKAKRNRHRRLRTKKMGIAEIKKLGHQIYLEGTKLEELWRDLKGKQKQNNVMLWDMKTF